MTKDLRPPLVIFLIRWVEIEVAVEAVIAIAVETGAERDETMAEMIIAGEQADPTAALMYILLNLSMQEKFEQR